MDDDDLGSARVEDTEGDIVDDVADFIDMKDAVEIKVDDDLPMEEDDDNNAALDQKSDGNQDEGSENPVADMSNFQLRSHTDSVYTVASFVENGSLSILSGGGDDKAFQHKISGAWWV